MVNRVEDRLTEPLFLHLQKKRYATLATMDVEKNIPYVNAISWVFARTDKEIFLAVDNRSRVCKNIKANGGAVLTMIANGSTYSISGKATIVTETIPNVPLKLALIKLEIDEVRDVMFYGAKLTVEPIYDNTYDEEAAAKLDKQVMDALRTYSL